MKVLITGGAGFIGSHLTDHLLKAGHQVAVIDNYQTGRRDNLKPHPHLQVFEGTIADKNFVYSVFENFSPNKVVHAAAAYKDPDNWEEDAQTNILGTIYVTQAAKKAGVNRFIYFQTALCYGLKPLEQPITLDHPISSRGSSYAISKTAGEHYLELSGLDFISFRLANAYGPRNLSGPLPTFFHRLTTNKACFVMNTRRDFIYIDDLVQVVLKALDGKGEKGYYHISSGSDYSIKELFDETVAALGITLGREVEIRERNPDDVFTILIDPAKTNQDFNWKVTTPLQIGVKAAVEWYKVHGITQTFTHLRLEEASRR
ncbi:NAD-dependent epimerase/dehydratase family protein [Parachlamydia sp. AcF125]|uniref:NAD-dependent epimerase/dehydratase family protein n=1 Tax=Parachlamydia sp. AcF125 TaxID=2795736 RepID=UPI001BC9DF07|nr:NAD-dependent epimerase/dehydratase family protein [Parachlamydia sp. AcF125]MBS4167732.1 UDP-glucose 4-epimerase [Parachlamydia sp. AcF125]